MAVAAFPSNDFGAQEPGSDGDIKSFCLTKYSISFDLYSKVVIKGAGRHPLYKYLAEDSGFPGDIPWNFTKFLIDREGRVAARFGPETNPMGKDFLAALEKTLGRP